MDAFRLVERWPVEHATVGVVDIGAQSGEVTTTGPVRGVFAWASVTKMATALAVLVAVEEGTLHVDEPAGPPGSTVRHLLSHASGLGPGPGPPLAAPGTSRIYSNVGYVVLGSLLAERSGLSFADYLRHGVLEPLALSGATLDAAAGEGAPAAGMSGTVHDLLALGSEWAAPTLVSRATRDEATTEQFPGLAGVLPGFGRFDPCPWGLGVEIRGEKRPHWTGSANSTATFGHFGQSGSFLWVDPVAGVVCGGLGDRPFGPWATRAWPELSDAVLTEVVDGRSGGAGSLFQG
jgi:CubicO group peptidase (beta-lactamase class C family)